MSIVFVLPLSLGLYAVALNLPVSVDEAFAGLIMPASAVVMLGKSGQRPLLQTRCAGHWHDARSLESCWSGESSLPGSVMFCVLHAGAILVIIICFMAVTSSGASEMLAVSSLFTFDVYRRYINPKVCCCS